MDSSRRPENEDFPVRDTSVNKIIHREMNGGSMKSALNRQAISKVDRVELEEKYLALYDENIVLKKYGIKRDEEIKRLTTIQARLENDRKKLMSDPLGRKSSDMNLVQQIELLNDKILQLERSNESLKMKLTVLRQKNVMSQMTLNSYPHVPSKIDSGVQKQYVDPRVIKNIRMIIQPTSSSSRGMKMHPRTTTVEASNQVDCTTPEQKSKNGLVPREELERLMEESRKKVEEYENTIRALKEQMRMAEREYEADLGQIRSRLGADQKNNVKENVDRIRLEREVKEKNMKFQQLHDQFMGLQEKMGLLKRSNEQAVTEIEELQDCLRIERSKVADLQRQVESGKSNKTLTMEHRTRMADLERECELLKESNTRLMNNALNVDKENHWAKREAALKLQINQLEQAMQADVADKRRVLDSMAQVKEELERVRCELKQVKAKNEELNRTNEEMKDKTSVFGENGAFADEEFVEALAMVRMKRRKDFREVPCGDEVDFIQKTDQDERLNTACLERQVRELQAQNTETANELEKTRNLLVVQYRINGDYKIELEESSRRLEEARREFEAQLDRYAQLLDIRAERIKKLEAQLRDVAYGTKRYNIGVADRVMKYGEDEEDDEDVLLENGQNLFEIHIKSLTLTEDCQRILNDMNPSMFCTWEFYDFELQSTPVLRGPRIDYKFTSQHVVQVDDFFIHYLQKDTCNLELHECLGSDYRTLAAGKIKLNGLLEKSSGRVHGTLDLIGRDGVSYGILEYWVRLRVPMEQALRLYKERSKALGYLESNMKQTPPCSPLDQSASKRPPNNINQLTIHIKSCKDIKALKCSAKQPSPYFVYKFYDFPDHDSPIIHSSNNPFFDNKRTYPVAMTPQLDSYLKTQVLKIYLFDDTDPTLESYLGIVSIPLVGLTHKEKIFGDFEVVTKDGSSNGTMEVSMSWKFLYLTPPQRGSNTPTVQRPIQNKQNQKPSLVPKTPSPPKSKQSSFHGDISTGTSKPRRCGKKSPEQPGRVSKTGDGNEPETKNGTKEDLNDDEKKDQNGAKKNENGKGNDDDDEEEEDKAEEMEDEEDYENESARVMMSPTQQSASPTYVTGNTADLTTQGSVKETITKQGSQSDDSDVVVPDKGPSQKTPEDTVTITVSYVKLTEDSPLLSDQAVQKLYVAFEFFGEPPEQTETPFSLPKPTQPNKAISFNFTRTFDVGQEKNMEKRYFVASMLMKEGIDGGRLRFTLISEPLDDEGDCEDVGVTFVSLPQMLEDDKDIIEEEVPIQASSTDTSIVGYMGITVQCLETLKNIHGEMQRTSVKE